MTTTDVLTSASITLSLLAALIFFIGVPVLLRKGASLHQDLAEGVNEFKVLSDNTWERIMAARFGKKSLGRSSRQTTEYGHCHCYDRKAIICGFFLKNFDQYFQKTHAHRDCLVQLVPQAWMENQRRHRDLKGHQAHLERQ